VRLDYLSRDHQAEPRAVSLRREERLEQFFARSRVYPWAFVLDADDHATAGIGTHRHEYPPARGRRLARVPEQIVQSLANCREFLKENAAMAREIEQKIREKAGVLKPVAKAEDAAESSKVEHLPTRTRAEK
jgi:hypothetical protein